MAKWTKAAWDLEALMEKKLPDMSVITLDAEFQKDTGLTATAHSKKPPARSRGLFVCRKVVTDRTYSGFFSSLSFSFFLSLFVFAGGVVPGFAAGFASVGAGGFSP